MSEYNSDETNTSSVVPTHCTADDCQHLARERRNAEPLLLVRIESREPFAQPKHGASASTVCRIDVNHVSSRSSKSADRNQ